ncbi:MAG: DNA/RNA nuclease SfsA [Candidatus Caldatribacterium sp.]|nr:DNA/RNA nuclease SfsA [Candidatus Caldatribacterium sp.]
MFRKARFCARLNRFVVLCEEDGRVFPAHLPNPGRLWEILLPGRTLLLKDQEKQSMPRVWGAVKGEDVVFLDTSATTLVAQRLIEEGQISNLWGYVIGRREVFLEGSRIDFLLKRDSERLFLEVKSCTLFSGGLAMFPDAVTTRGKRHLELLGRVGGAILFVVHSPSCFAFLPDFHTDPDFAWTLYALRERLRIYAVAVRWDEDGNFAYVRTLPIPWEVYEREAQDRGSYLLSGHLRGDVRVSVGRIGEYCFRKGFYLYVGSAMRSLSERIRRHFRKGKKKRWHIDFLVPFLEDLRAFPVQSSERLECALSRELRNVFQEIPLFGASDCSCASHLFYVPQPPLQNEAFVEILLRFRIGRIAEKLRSC